MPEPRIIPISELIKRLEGEELARPEPGYTFGNRRVFYTPPDTGAYSGDIVADEWLLTDGSRPMDDGYYGTTSQSIVTLQMAYDALGLEL